MSSIYHKHKNQHSIHQHILNPKEDLGPMGPLEALRGPMWKITKLVRIRGQRDFIWLSNYENRPCSLPRCVPDKFVPIGPFILGPLGPWGPYSPPPKSSSNELRKQDPCESSGNLLQNRRKNYFWPILALLRVQIPPKYDPWGPIFYTLPKVVQVSLKN